MGLGSEWCSTRTVSQTQISTLDTDSVAGFDRVGRAAALSSTGTRLGQGTDWLEWSFWGDTALGKEVWMSWNTVGRSGRQSNSFACLWHTGYLFTQTSLQSQRCGRGNLGLLADHRRKSYTSDQSSNSQMEAPP